MPICLVPISPSAHLPQIIIFLKSQFAPSPYLLRCPFAPNAHLPQVSVYSKFSISPKYPFTSVPSCHSAHHFPKSPSVSVPICPKCPFAPSTQLSRIQMSRIYLTGTQMYGPNYLGLFLQVPIYPGAHLSVTQMYGPQLSETHLPGVHLSWCPFVLVPICPEPKCPKTACYTPHLHLITSKLLQKCLAIARWRNLNCVDTAFSTSLPD